MQQTIDWHSHWIRKNPGFHEGQVNRYLEQFLPEFHLNPADTVFMPLCGKAVDILWLSRQGYQVIGVELSEVAVQAFFEESQVAYKATRQDQFMVYEAENITLYQGDLMHLRSSQLADCKLVYDRASIVAIEPFNRAAYKYHMLEIIPAGCPILMVTLEYDQNIMQGPPFSVPVNEISTLYHPQYSVQFLHSNEQSTEGSRWRERGLQSLIESAIRLDAV